ncbi:AGC family protein kinase [Trichomonas vaginalis G3]|uniref:non-specific serine/threonine protein kinase n=1 Tax=Trichomonas vaginalis (strain ATCC PRA-98 / G3) TaxID=412133 RepID=A2FBB6_TRIV3|nr:protein serine/threonine kinase protein [Trichomonas vaginalis G3]EAX97796.1 AGC family protein kinase [Trichomonas vaginalis G3]KAI5552728.1 protein serine/threonine kinase protein [Trichomonas vaginalis G3]|eukprot:XP_001310726.1 AGC family protein kinase [Trichomonas vaginalis G3]
MAEEELNLPVGNYILRQRIGEGAFSSVWLADCKDVSIPAAVKIISKSTLDQPDVFTRFQREISLLQQCSHPFITHFYELYEDTNRYYVFMEYAENGDFESFLQTRGRLPENMSRFFFAQLITALDYLHNTCRIAHRDLKPQNILLDRYNNIRITDFGLSKAFNDVVPNLTSNCGSPAYAAPEVIIGKPYNKAADVWSLGVILYQMATGHLPFQSPDVKTVLMKIVSFDPPYPPTMSSQLIDLLRRMLCRNPSKRITIKEIMEHPWVVPQFVSRVSSSLSELHQENTAEGGSPRQQNPAKLQQDCQNLVFVLSEKMDQARQLLPTNNYNSPPASLPHHIPKFAITKISSNSILIKDLEPGQRPQLIKKSRSASNYPSKHRGADLAPEMTISE